MDAMNKISPCISLHPKKEADPVSETVCLKKLKIMELLRMFVIVTTKHNHQNGYSM
jgi:hypothetical protein